jgi:hypothetical protein
MADDLFDGPFRRSSAEAGLFVGKIPKCGIKLIDLNGQGGNDIPTLCSSLE